LTRRKMRTARQIVLLGVGFALVLPAPVNWTLAGEAPSGEEANAMAAFLGSESQRLAAGLHCRTRESTPSRPSWLS
jgi:hypothetical protein